MTYQVLARKWRPQTFADLVGQDHISSTLCNAIKNERIGHAYLFVGTRGTGKTTTARIFAKAINCENPLPNANPCDKCTNCVEITNGSCMDVLEIDGASNNGVDDIRRLRDNVQYTPARCKYKVYIIDEVHMLSTAAWNALLKTLEEPPEHVKFLFATTEAHKVLPTILSRCQRFDLKRITQGTISRRLKLIADAEKASFDESALNSISRAANGGMRDALSIMDQMIAFCSNQETITEHDVSDVFGLTSNFDLAKIASAMLSDDAVALITEINRLANLGRNLEQLYSDLLHFSRNLMICSISAEQADEILDLDEHELKTALSISSQTTPDIVQKLVDGFLNNDGKLRGTLNKRVFIEMTLLRIMKDAHAISLNDILRRINQMRQGGSLDALEQIAPATKISLPEPQKKNLTPTPPQSSTAEEVTQTIPEPPVQEEESNNTDQQTTPEVIILDPEPVKIKKSDIELVEVNDINIQADTSSDLAKLETIQDEPVLNTTDTPEPKPQEFKPVAESDIELVEVDGITVSAEQDNHLSKLETVKDIPVLKHTQTKQEKPATSQVPINDSYALPFSTLVDQNYIEEARKKDPLKLGLKKSSGKFDTEDETPGAALGLFYTHSEDSPNDEKRSSTVETSQTANETANEIEQEVAQVEPETIPELQDEIAEQENTQVEQPHEATPQEEAPTGSQIEQSIQAEVEPPQESTTTVNEPESNYQTPPPTQTETEPSLKPVAETSKQAAAKLWSMIDFNSNQLLQTALAKIIPLSLQENTFFAALEDNTSADSLTEEIQQLEVVLKQVSESPELEFKIIAAQKDKEQNAIQLSSGEEVWSRVKNNKFVTDICTTFDGTIIDVRG